MSCDPRKPPFNASAHHNANSSYPSKQKKKLFSSLLSTSLSFNPQSNQKPNSYNNDQTSSPADPVRISAVFNEDTHELGAGYSGTVVTTRVIGKDEGRLMAGSPFLGDGSEFGECPRSVCTFWQRLVKVENLVKVSLIVRDGVRQWQWRGKTGS